MDAGGLTRREPKHMHKHESKTLGDRPEWILRLLYAPAEGNVAAPIVGTTRLMKGCFLIHKKLESELGMKTDFKFHPDRYGPLDPKVYDSIERLEKQGLVAISESREYSGTEYTLTPDGKSEARVLYNDLPGEAQELLSWLKSKHILSPLPKLLSFVYNQYPETTKNSEIA